MVMKFGIGVVNFFSGLDFKCMERDMRKRFFFFCFVFAVVVCFDLCLLWNFEVVLIYIWVAHRFNFFYIDLL